MTEQKIINKFKLNNGEELLKKSLKPGSDVGLSFLIDGFECSSKTKVLEVHLMRKGTVLFCGDEDNDQIIEVDIFLYDLEASYVTFNVSLKEEKDFMGW